MCHFDVVFFLQKIKQELENSQGRNEPTTHKRKKAKKDKKSRKENKQRINNFFEDEALEGTDEDDAVESAVYRKQLARDKKRMKKEGDSVRRQ